jgi:hypothetical protein
MTQNPRPSDPIDDPDAASEPPVTAPHRPGLPLPLWLNALGLLAFALPAVAASRLAGDAPAEADDAAPNEAGRAPASEAAEANSAPEGTLDPGIADAEVSADEADASSAASERAAIDGDGNGEDAATDQDDEAAGAAIVAIPIGAAGRRVRPRRVERAMKQQQAAEEALEEADDQHPALGPVVRHLNNVLRDLQEAHQQIGVLTTQRDSLRQQLKELSGEPVIEEDDGTPRPNRDARLAARAEAESEAADQMGRIILRRRLIAAGALAAIATGVFVGKSMGANLDSISRESLAHLPYIGDLMSVFLIGWLLYRVARVSGKGVRWLFPEPEKQRKRRR